MYFLLSPRQYQHDGVLANSHADKVLCQTNVFYASTAQIPYKGSVWLYNT